ncbi:PQQ-dependent sugar dehydrogenase [Candidatus Gracilibacteria bacterium]|nr:PQQ-dependent sugar dehydrogenase [Candidatus Gracilibacteria bacterium]
MKYLMSVFLLASIIFITGCNNNDPEKSVSTKSNGSGEIENKGINENKGNLQEENKSVNQDDITISPWIEGLDTPWELVFVDSDTALVTQRRGVISIIKNGVLQSDPYWEAPSTEFGEGGLMGLEKDPNYENNGFLYTMYGTDKDTNIDGYITKVVRLKENSAGELEINKILIDNIPAAKYHDGGRIKFGPDDKLYITTGDATNPDLAQDLNSLAGKILRINSDGSIPNDNPFENSPVYSYGHRNPQGLAWNEAGDLFMSTHGPSGEFGLTAKDRVDYITAGTNYGWPEAYGPDQGFPNPLAYWPDTATPPGGMVFWNESLYVATMNSETLVKLDIENSQETYKLINEERWFEGEYGRLRNIIEGPDNNLYLMTTNADGRGSIGPGKDIIYKVSIK